MLELIGMAKAEFKHTSRIKGFQIPKSSSDGILSFFMNSLSGLIVVVLVFTTEKTVA